ncbi:MAG: carbohydrate-binding protein, partial [Tepidisphaeraceae bacterium]
MMRLSRVFTSFTLACCLAAPASWFAARADDTTSPPANVPTPVPGETTPAPATPAAMPDNTAAPSEPSATTQPAETATP